MANTSKQRKRKAFPPCILKVKGPTTQRGKASQQRVPKLKATAQAREGSRLAPSQKHLWGLDI